MNLFKKISDKLFSTTISGVYIILFAVSIATATFIENDYGTSSAQNAIFKSWWFELILLLFAISLIINIFRFRMIQQKKWAIVTFHAAIVVILIGAGITRYFGSEGIMHIREGATTNSFLSSESYLQFEARSGGEKYRFEEAISFSTLGNNDFKRSYIIGNEEVYVEVQDFIPNPKEILQEDKNGIPILSIVMGGMNGREEYYLKYKDQVNINGTVFNFDESAQNHAINIKYEGGRLFFKTNSSIIQMQMATQTKDTLLPVVYHPLLLRSLYSNARTRFVISDFKPTGKLIVTSSSEKMTSTSIAGLDMKIGIDGQDKNFYLYGRKGVEGKPANVSLGTTSFSITYGAKKVFLPFEIKLNKFIMDKYPGTNSASSYASEITLLDPSQNLERNQRIYMNHILNYGGYRFFQSSFDKDELGTYLSVNFDSWGTWISYIGYIILTLGMIFTLFTGKSRFGQLAKNIKKMRQSVRVLAPIVIGLLMIFFIPSNASPLVEQNNGDVDIDHASQFGRLTVQDHNGRLKPMNTYAKEILRKISRKESINGQTAEQVVLGMAANPKDWYAIRIIKLGKHEEIRKILKIEEEMASYRDFFEANGPYKLRDQVRAAYNTPPIDRGVFEKEILKLDEKVNICSMVFSGRFMRAFPIPDDLSYHWQSPADGGLQHSGHNHNAGSGNTYAEKFYSEYILALQQALDSYNWIIPNKMIAELNQYQQKNGGEIMPSNAKIKAEILLNKLKVFGRLGTIYALLGLIFLGLLFTSIFKPGINLKWPFYISFSLLASSFFMHTLGLGLRWYVSGRAPWSNGYESMIYIAFTTILAGLIFSRKSFGGLAATSILSATILMVAGLSWLDPEITPLVPVLKSYWLTIHVSLEAGSYGFLMLGAIIGVLNLILMIFRNKKNGENVNRILKEMTYISEMTLIVGLFMISVGTYLGGVWANESWGRYWGWDAKETWALVTILVYAFILHMRFIPGLRGIYAFNVASLFGWASVMMTYFGVNYYLSGLHSYAAGDPVPIPPFVYYTVFVLLIICLLAYFRNLQNRKTNLSKSAA